jgi:ABC-type antimicrobial peptide transport system permease subunit
VGLYAVLAFVVRQRTRELAIRHALGATPSRLRALVLRQAMLLAGTGALWGLLVALAGARLLRSLLFGVSPTDPLTLTTVTATLVAVALAAAYIPARRATRADAAAILRDN